MLSKKVGEAMLEHHQIELLKTLSNLVGVSGHEEPILQFVSEQLHFCTKEQDKLCTAPQKLDMKNLTFGVFFYEINL